MVCTARPACGRRVCLIRGDARVTPYVARGFRRRQVCHTRVQELAFGGQLTKVCVSNVKSGEIGPYRRYSASTWVPEQLPAPLDSARNEIGQLSIGESGGVGQCQLRNWTVVHQAGIRPGGTVDRGREVLPGGSGQPAGTVAAVLPFAAVRASGRQANRRNSSASAATFRTKAAGTGWQMQAGTW